MAQVTGSLRIAILGPGAVGGFLAAAFHKIGVQATLIAKEERLPELAEKGITLNSEVLGNVHFTPSAVATLTEPADLIFITTKAIGLAQALKRIQPKAAQGAVFIPLLNGVEHLNLIRETFPNSTVLAGSIQIETKYISPTQFDQPSPHAKIEFNAHPKTQQGRQEQIVNLLTQAKLNVEVIASERDVVWRKLAKLSALACATASHNEPIGVVLANPQWKQELIDCIKEGVNVAVKDGATLNFEEVWQSIERLPAKLGTSLQRDVNAGKPNELDAIPGAVVRLGLKYGIPCPVTQMFMQRISARAEKIKGSHV